METLTFESEKNESIKNSRMNIIEIKRLISFMKIFVHNFNSLINFSKKIFNSKTNLVMINIYIQI